MIKSIMELIKIETTNTNILHKQDYLYNHNKDTYPLQNEFSLNNFFLIIKADEIKLQVLCFSNNNVLEIQLSELQSGNWYYFKIPPLWKKQLNNY